MWTFLWFLYINLAVYVIIATRVLLYQNDKYELFGDQSNKDIDHTKQFSLHWINLEVKPYNVDGRSDFRIYIYRDPLLKIQWYLRTCDFHKKIVIDFFLMEIKGKNLSLSIDFNFRDKYRQIDLNCSQGYIINNIINYPDCKIYWGPNTTCSEFLERKYKIIWFLKDKQIKNFYLYEITVNITFVEKATGNITGYKMKNITMYYIDKTKYICNVENLPARVILHYQNLSFECKLHSPALFVAKYITFSIFNENQKSWNFSFNFKPKDKYRYLNPTRVDIDHTVTFMVYGQKTKFILRKDVLIIFFKWHTSICEKVVNSNFTLYYFTTIVCSGNILDLHLVYLKIINVTNQSSLSYNTTNELEFYINKLWVPERQSRVEGSIIVSSAIFYSDEQYRKLFDISFNVKLVVVRDFEILPSNEIINLPQIFMVKCISMLPVHMYLIIPKIKTFQNNSCFLTISLPVLNLHSLVMNVYIKYEAFWINYTKRYLIGRIPTIVIVSSRFPKLNKPIICFTDGENVLYSFQWSCTDENEPKTMIAIFYLSRNKASLIFWDSAPLIIYQCYCFVNFVTVHNRTVFSVSASVKLNLNDNVLANCELRSSSRPTIIYGIFIIYFLILLLAPGIFILSVYIATKGIFKDTIENDILSKLGFFKNDFNLLPNVIPKFIISKSDFGNSKFKIFFERLHELEKQGTQMKINNFDIKDGYTLMKLKKRGHTREILSDSKVEIIAKRKEKIRKQLFQRYKAKQEKLATIRGLRDGKYYTPTWIKRESTYAWSHYNSTEENGRQHLMSERTSHIKDLYDWRELRPNSLFKPLSENSEAVTPFMDFTIPLDATSTRHSSVYLSKSFNQPMYSSLKKSNHMDKMKAIVKESLKRNSSTSYLPKDVIQISPEKKQLKSFTLKLDFQENKKRLPISSYEKYSTGNV